MTIGTIMSWSQPNWQVEHIRVDRATGKPGSILKDNPHLEPSPRPRFRGLRLRVDHGAAWRRWPPASSNAADPPGTVERALRS